MRCSCSTCTRPARCGLRGGSHKLARAAVRRANGASPHATPGARMYGVGLSSSTIATRALKRVVGLPTRSAIACSPARLGTPRPACPQGVAMHICSSSARRTRSGPLIERQPCRGARAVSPHWPLDSRAVRRSAQMNRRRHLSQFASGTRCVVSRETAACRCNAWHTGRRIRASQGMRRLNNISRQRLACDDDFRRRFAQRREPLECAYPRWHAELCTRAAVRG